MAELLQPEDFLSVEEPLVVDLGSGEAKVAIALAVESVKNLPPHRLRAHPFALTMSGPRSPALAQGTYPVRHPSLGMIDLFLVPIGRDAKSTRYEVVFN